MIKKLTVRILALLMPLLMPQSGVWADEPEAYEIPRSQVISIQDTVKNRAYDLYIRLPEGYGKDASVKHPVVYTTDGAWHMEMLSTSAEFILSNAIVVAISWQKDAKGEFEGDARPHLSRFRDYTFLPATNPAVQAKYNVGQARHHLSFIRDGVIKYVEENYQTDPAERIYFGYSLGGAFGAYILLEEPEIFKHYVLGSPAVDEADLEFLGGLSAAIAADDGMPSVNVFVSVGEKETEQMGNINALMALLEQHSGTGLSLGSLDVVSQAGHSEAAPATAVRSFMWLSALMEK